MPVAGGAEIRLRLPVLPGVGSAARIDPDLRAGQDRPRRHEVPQILRSTAATDLSSSASADSARAASARCAAVSRSEADIQSRNFA